MPLCACGMIMLLSALKYITLKLWNDYVVICIKIYNFKGSKKYDRFYVIDFYFAKVHRNGPSFHL